MMHADPLNTRDFTALESLEGALDWWREAGVDADFADEASGWLVEPESENAVAAPPPPAPPPIQRKTAVAARARSARRRLARNRPRRPCPPRSKNFANGG